MLSCESYRDSISHRSPNGTAWERVGYLFVCVFFFLPDLTLSPIITCMNLKFIIFPNVWVIDFLKVIWLADIAFGFIVFDKAAYIDKKWYWRDVILASIHGNTSAHFIFSGHNRNFGRQLNISHHA